MAHIFSSYAQKDTRSLAEKLYDELNSIPGLTAWIDMSLEADDSWAMQIQREINACDYMVVLLSPDVNRPETDTQAYSFVLKEIAFAQMRKIRILPVMVQQTDMPLTIADVQYIDITKNPNDPTKIVERVCTLAELRQKEAAEQARREREAEEKRRKELLQQQQEEEQRQEQRRREEAARLAELQKQQEAEIERDSTDLTPPEPMPAVKPQYDYSSPPQQTNVVSTIPYDYDMVDSRGNDPGWSLLLAVVVLVFIVGGGALAVFSLTNRDSQSPTPTVGVVEDTGDESDATAQPISEATDTATPTDTPTSTHTPGGPTATARSTRTPTSTPTSTYTPEPNHVTPQVSSNAEWTPVEETIAGIPMVLVPAGCFIMGRDDYAEDEKPAHEQCVDEFWIGKYEVTNAQFAEFINAGGYDNPEYWTEAGWEIRQDESWTAPRYWDDPNFNNANQPVVGVSWYEALAYATWRGATLPTEAQWEYAARGPDSLLYPWGNEYDGAVFIHNGSTDGTTAEVGSKPEGASWVGALDLSGNVGEWTLSRFASYPYVANDGREVIPGRSSREMRGSTWYSRTVEGAQSADRNAVYSTLRNDVYGFRVAHPAN